MHPQNHLFDTVAHLFMLVLVLGPGGRAIVGIPMRARRPIKVKSVNSDCTRCGRTGSHLYPQGSNPIGPADKRGCFRNVHSDLAINIGSMKCLISSESRPSPHLIPVRARYNPEPLLGD